MYKLLTQIQNTFSHFGLSASETKIIFALTKYGPLTVLGISQSSELTRSSVYNYIQRLVNRGIISLTIDDFVKKYKVISPEELENLLIISNQKDVQKTITSLKTIENSYSETSEIIITKGIESLKKTYQNILTSRDKTDYMVKGGDYESWLKMDKVFFGGFEVRRGATFEKIRCLFNPTSKIKQSNLTPNSNNTIIKVLPLKTKISTNTILVNGTKITHQLHPPYKCIIIKNTFLFEAEKQDFELMWSLIK
jgi:predicted transcriptional regulator